MDTNAIIMWILVIVIIVGYVLVYRNLNGRYFKTRYEGLIISIIGLVISCIVGVKTGAVENFLSL
jgi:uncharacterized membrane protein YecN with MAPEG domain